MSRELELGKVAFKGSLHLSLGRILSKVISVIGVILLIRFLQSEGYGLLNVALVAPGIFALFNDFGINTALTKYLAEYRSKGEPGNLKNFLYLGLFFKIASSLGVTIICYLVADTFATVALGKPHVAPFIRLASLFVFAWMLYGFAEFALIGLDATRTYAILMILFESLKAILPLVLITYGMGVFGALMGIVSAWMVAGCIGIFSSLLITLKLSRGMNPSFTSKHALKKMLTFGVPLAIAGLASTGLANFFGFMIAAYSDPNEIGNYTAANKANSTVLFLAFPIMAILFPTFSKLNPETESATLRKVYNYSVKYSSFFVLPAFALLAILSRPLTVLFFGVDFDTSWLYLMLLAIQSLSYGLGGEHLLKLLAAQNETKLVLKLNLLKAIIAISLSLILVPSYGILGLIATFFIMNWPSYVLAVKKAHEKYKLMPPLSDIARVFASLTVMVASIVPIAVFLNSNDILKIFVCGLVGTVVFVISLPMTKAISQSDIHILRNITKPQPLVGTLVEKILQIVNRIANWMY